MRRRVLNTTDVIAAGMASVPVDGEAADKISLGLGVYFNAFAVYVDQDDGPGANQRNHKIASETEPIEFVVGTILEF